MGIFGLKTLCRSRVADAEFQSWQSGQISNPPS
jgi:hypothetical protein